MMRYKPKKSKDGQVLLNLACGIITEADWNNLDFSLYSKLRRHTYLTRILNLIGIISQERFNNLQKIDKHIIHWDLRKGLPFDSDVFDCIYMGQFIEHLEKDKLPLLLKECYRVLCKGGIVRIVTPNLEACVLKYIDILNQIENDFNNNSLWQQYDDIMNNIFEQIVRKESFGTSKQKPFVRIVEIIIKGGPEKSGELHKWLYDYYSLKRILEKIGYQNITKLKPCTSNIKDFETYSLEKGYLNSNHDKDLFVEAIK